MIGPVFNRAVLTLPRRGKHFFYRGAYAAALLLLACTAWQVLAGTQVVRNTGDFARFGSMLFQVMAPLQLSLALFTSALWSAASIAAEKDRRTLDLILLTEMSNAQYLLGKLFGSLLLVWFMLGAALPVFALVGLFGGVAPGQVARAFAITLASTFMAGSLGATLAVWREKTFQTLAITGTLLVLWLVAWEIVASGALGALWFAIPTADWAVAFSPWRAILAATQPHDAGDLARRWLSESVIVFVPTSFAVATMLALWGIARFRVWNPPRENQRGLFPTPHLASQSSLSLTPVAVQPGVSKTRRVWRNPILWREVRTWAYGRKLLLMRIAYLLLCGLAAGGLYILSRTEIGLTRTSVATAMVPLFVLSLVLVNAQAVTSITAERDGKALDLLLVTDLTAPEFIYGKLAGALYNTKEMILAPVLLCLSMWAGGALGLENLIYLVGGAGVLYLFVTMLGIHVGLAYGHSPTAIAVSLGTVFFLFVGVATCMRVIVAFSGSFQVQLQPFLAFMVGGGVGLFLALGARNPSTAILAASLLCPFVTFYAITSFLLGQTLNVFLVTAGMYGFATAAMLIPAIHEFDVAATRTAVTEE